MIKTTTKLIGLTLLGTSFAQAQDDMVDDVDYGVLDEPTTSIFNDFGVGVQGGSLGIGPVITYDINHWLYLKAEGNFFSMSIDDLDGDDISYSGDLDLFSAGVTINARPFHKHSVIDGFKISLGLFAVNNEASLEAGEAGDSVEIGDTTYVLGAGDKVVADAGFDAVAPYVGIGWDWSFGDEDTFTVSLEAGALFTGEPDVEIETKGFAVAQADLDKEVQAFEDDADLKIYPVFKLGFLYRF